MYRKLAAPMNVQFEITSKCNEKCIHCYNYWRSDQEASRNISMKLFDKCMDEIIKNKVLHLILTGGEPFMNFDVLLHGIKRCKNAGMSVSCNSNLLAANKKKLVLLAKEGLPHILTSLNSHIPKVNDFMVSHKGALNKIIKNIEHAISAGIRVSANMIVSDQNINHIYNTAKLAHELGISKFHVTRVVPPSYIKGSLFSSFTINIEKLEKILGHVDEINKRLPIKVKTLIPYPLCALKDLDKYKDFVGRPCAAGKRSMSIDFNGKGHACWHMIQDFGSIPDDGLDTVWNRMEEWRSGQLIPDVCKKCPYLPLCGSGCRVAGQVFNGSFSGADNLRIGWSKITKKYTGSVGVDDSDISFEKIISLYNVEEDKNIANEIFTISDINIRKEGDFAVIQLHAGTSFFLEHKYVKILEKMKKLSSFKVEDFGEVPEKFFLYMLIKGVIKKTALSYSDQKAKTE